MSVQIPSINDQGLVSNIEASEVVFARPYNETLIHQMVVRYLALGRAGTKAQKTRSEVSGGGSKPWRQKGSGRARAGTTRGPLWRTGGVTFAAKPRSYAQKINKKMYRTGLASIYSELLRQNRLVIKDDIYPDTYKTKAMYEKLRAFADQRVLLIVDRIDENLELATRNLPFVEVATVDSVSPVALVGAEKVFATTQAIKNIEGRLS